MPSFIFQYISNKMQRYTVYFIWKLLYIFLSYILTYIQQDATLQSLFYLETALYIS
jgi:hypothetical protein